MGFWDVCIGDASVKGRGGGGGEGEDGKKRPQNPTKSLETTYKIKGT